MTSRGVPETIQRKSGLPDPDVYESSPNPAKPPFQTNNVMGNRVNMIAKKDAHRLSGGYCAKFRTRCQLGMCEISDIFPDVLFGKYSKLKFSIQRDKQGRSNR